MATIDASQITFGKKYNDFISTKVKGGIARFVVGTVDEPLRAPFGVSEPKKPQNGGKEWKATRKTMDLEVEDSTLAELLASIDAAVVAQAIKDPLNFFGKELDEDTIRAKHQPLLTTKETFLPTVRTKVKIGTKDPTVVRVVSGERKFRRGTADDVATNAKVMAHVKLDSVWFAAGKFGVSLSVDDLVVWPVEEAKDRAFPGFDFAEE
jgi:hypothetical protein